MSFTHSRMNYSGSMASQMDGIYRSSRTSVGTATELESASLRKLIAILAMEPGYILGVVSG
jgi:hypothetical protein